MASSQQSDALIKKKKTCRSCISLRLIHILPAMASQNQATGDQRRGRGREKHASRHEQRFEMYFGYMYSWIVWLNVHQTTPMVNEVAIAFTSNFGKYWLTCKKKIGHCLQTVLIACVAEICKCFCILFPLSIVVTVWLPYLNGELCALSSDKCASYYLATGG